MKKLIIVIVVVMVGVLLTACGGGGLEGVDPGADPVKSTGSLTGAIKDEAGNLLENVTVSLGNKSQTVNNSYSFTDLEAGKSYTLTAQHTAYTDWSKSVVINEGNNLQDITMTEKASNPGDSNWSTYQDPQEYYTIEYPSDWNYQENYLENDIVFGTTDFPGLISVTVPDNVGISNDEEFFQVAEYVATEISSAMTEVDRGTINGNTIIGYQVKEDGTFYGLALSYSKESGYLYGIHLVCDSQDEVLNTYGPIFEQMLESFIILH